MAKRDIGTKGTQDGVTAIIPPGDTMETRVVAFAEQLGRIAGTVLGKTEGWMDREALAQQLASVRDGAAGLLEQLAGNETAVSTDMPVAGRARRTNVGRSGGKVDAPGKKHRKPVPAAPEARLAGSQAAKMRTARPMAKSNRHRGRG